jgi:hypothetical protein
MARYQNNGVRKACNCGRRRWAACRQAWRLNFKFGETRYRLALDRELGRRLKDRDEATAEAEVIRAAIRGGTFRRPVPVVALPADLTFAAHSAHDVAWKNT